jgi:hypothetical protein
MEISVFSGIAALLVAVLGSGGIASIITARAKAQPVVMEAVSGAMASLAKHYTAELQAQGIIIGALRDDVRKLSMVVLEQSDKISEQTETIEGLEEHIDALSDAMKAAGVPPPERKRKPKSTKT